MFHPLYNLNHPQPLFSLLNSKTTEGTPDVQDRIGTISTSKLIKLEIFPKVGGEYSQQIFETSNLMVNMSAFKKGVTKNDGFLEV